MSSKPSASRSPIPATETPNESPKPVPFHSWSSAPLAPEWTRMRPTFCRLPGAWEPPIATSGLPSPSTSPTAPIVSPSISSTSVPETDQRTAPDAPERSAAHPACWKPPLAEMGAATRRSATPSALVSPTPARAAPRKSGDGLPNCQRTLFWPTAPLPAPRRTKMEPIPTNPRLRVATSYIVEFQGQRDGPRSIDPPLRAGGRQVHGGGHPVAALSSHSAAGPPRRSSPRRRPTWVARAPQSAPSERLLRRAQRPLGVLRSDVAMGDEAHDVEGVRVRAHASLLEALEEPVGAHRVADAQEDDVGLGPLRIDLKAGNAREASREALRKDMSLGAALDHVLERVDPRRGEVARLPPASPHRLADPSGL